VFYGGTPGQGEAVAEEHNSGPITDSGTQSGATETSLREELERVRSGNKAFKVVATVLSVIFLCAAIFGFIVYRKISQAKAMLESVSEGFKPIEGASENEPGKPLRADFSAVQQQSSSGLGLFSMPRGGVGTSEISSGPPDSIAAAAALVRGQEMLKVLGKYKSRPIVKDFLAEMEKDPQFAAARKQGKSPNPVEMLAQLRKSGNAKDLMLKYSRRPDFMSFMMELMRDPEMRPFMQGMPGMAGGGQMPSVSKPSPIGQPSGRTAPRQTDTEPEAEADADGDGEITFNPSAISGAPAPAAAPRQPARTAPPPIDSGQ
jgi:hypothetical protein